MPVDLDRAERAAALHVPDPKPPHDAVIGAAALARSLTPVTRNVRHFRGITVGLMNPWAGD